ncbi:MAG: ParB N-terminal domain-containing protein [Erysipelotrichaceae bacterium]|nr:ParB N-terminal domain-containing protein [Erysipelotrichaceae bacterium]
MLSELIDEPVKINNKPVLKTIDIDDIIPNDMNNKNRLRNIDVLKESIKEYGLLKPLEVYDNNDDTYTLIGGERRYHALIQLVENDEIDPDIPCLIYKVNNNAEELLKLHMSNAQEELTDKDRELITNDLLNLLEEDNSMKPTGMKTRDWIAGFLGCKGRTAQKYINKVKGIEDKEKPKEQVDYSYVTKIMTNRLCTKVKVSKGKATIYFQDIDDLNGILERMGVIEDV